MTAILVRLRSELRARWRTWLSLTLMLGLFGGAVIAIAAGARRTDSAYPRFLAWSRAPDVLVPRFTSDIANGVFGLVTMKDVEALPQVVDSARLRLYQTTTDQTVNAPGDARLGAAIDRVKVIQGRLPRGPDEVALNWLEARKQGVGIGDTIHLSFPPTNGSGIDHVVRLPLRVVGLEVAPGGFPPTLTDTPSPIVSRAFDTKYYGKLFSFDVAAVRLKRGFSDIRPFLDGITRLTHGKPLFTERQDTQAANVERSFHLQAVALWLMAGLTALVVLLVFSQTLARQTFLESGENPTLSSLGMTRSQLLAIALMRVGVVAVGGAVIAAIVAALASPLFPTGVARVAEIHPGFHLDLTAVGVGAFAILVVTAMFSVIPAWRAATRTTEAVGAETERPSSVATTLAKTWVPASGAAGVRMALERGRGRTAVPVRTAVAGVTIGIAALTAALTFGASLDHLLGTPRLYGVTWNVQAYANLDFNKPKNQQDLIRAVHGIPGIAAWGVGTLGLGLTVDGVPADILAVYNREGGVEPPILEGKAPSRAGEIALGSKTLDQLHKHIGDTVNVGVFGGRAKPMNVVGVAVTPPVGDVGQFGKGGLIDYRSAHYLVPGAPSADTLLVRTTPGTDPESVGQELAKRIPKDDNIEISLPSQPSDLVNFGGVQNFPLYLAMLVALMAAATLAHVLVTSIRRRRRDLAILKTVGFQRGQLTSTVAWQASTLALLALAIGIPLGVVVGRWIWTAFSDQLGILPSPAVPIVTVLLTVPATLLLANLIAYLPGRAAAKVQAATILRTE
jgi:ABC-type lipoprotein release transport system permease subunit